MTRLIAQVLGVLLAALLVLALLWLAGQVLAGLGLFLVALSRVLVGVLRFLVVSGVLGGLAYFLASSWRRRA